MIRVLIADDSAFMRKVLSDLFKSGTAVNGQDAIDKVKRFQPDVLTLDVVMPVMDGLEALAVIMEQCPLPVVMISSATQKGTNETIRALALGAVDFVSKAGGAISKIDTIKDEILAKCRLAAKTQARKSFSASKPLVYKPKLPDSDGTTRRIEVKRRTGFVPAQRPTIGRTPVAAAPVRRIIPGTGKKLSCCNSSARQSPLRRGYRSTHAARFHKVVGGQIELNQRNIGQGGGERRDYQTGASLHCARRLSFAHHARRRRTENRFEPRAARW